MPCPLAPGRQAADREPLSPCWLLSDHCAARGTDKRYAAPAQVAALIASPLFSPAM